MKQIPLTDICPICQNVDTNCGEMNCETCSHEDDCVQWHDNMEQCDCTTIMKYEYYYQNHIELTIENNELLRIITKQRTMIRNLAEIPDEEY